MFNNIRNNTINEIDAKKHLNTLKEIRNAGIKYKRLIPKQKELLNLFSDLLDTILTDKTLMSSKEENENEGENENEDKENENENENETMDQKEIKNLNDSLDEIIDKSKSFEDQIESLKKLEDLKEHLSYNDYDDKALKFNVLN